METATNANVLELLAMCAKVINPISVIGQQRISIKTN